MTGTSTAEWQTLHYLPLEGYVSFNLEKTVCSHGFFMMPPNNWDSSTNTLERPFRLFSDSTCSIPVRISHDIISLNLNVQVPAAAATLLSPKNKQVLLAQVARMLRISKKDELDITTFHSKNPKAKILEFGRIFRSPTLFEDTIKCMLLCNCRWGRSLEMAQALCQLQLVKKKKRKRGKRKTAASFYFYGDFPNSRELACVDVQYLVKHCNLGYRAANIINLAKKVERGELPIMNVRAVYEEEASVMTIRESFKGMPGFGDFTCSYVLTCMGFYHNIPVDSETARHLQMQHVNIKTVRMYAHELYGKFKPFQFLAYWFELWEFYESKFGKLSQLSPDSFRMVTGSH